MTKVSSKISVPNYKAFLVKKFLSPKKGSDTQIYSPVGTGNTLLETTRVSLLNGISFCPMVLARCMRVTDITERERQTSHATVTSVTIGSIFTFSNAT